jgi:2-polyprenyl-6-methoxyphenol hydroxylase-like FAD-dependent oxidoreductase
VIEHTVSVDQRLATAGRDVHTVRFPTGSPPSEIDVLVVGAGPVGLSTAIELDGRGVGVAVVDAVRFKELIRAGAMGHNPRTVEHFRRWGLLHRIREEWTFPPEWNRGTVLTTSLVGHELVPMRKPSFRQRSAATGVSSGEALRRPQTALQKVFLDHLAERDVHVTGGWRLEGLSEDAAGITAELVETETGERRHVRAKYVVGADGGSSAVRWLTGINRDGERATEKRLRLVVRTGDISDRVGPTPSASNIVFNEKASGFLAAISTREWRIYAGPYPVDYEPSEQELLEVGRAAFGFDLDLDLVSATIFYNATRVAQTFRKGRVLLAGDAAHVRTPGGNLGEGIGDVANLGWKLAAVLNSQAPDALLDSYDAERRPHNWRIGDYALDLARRSSAMLEELRHEGIPADSDLSDTAQRRRAEISQRIASERGFGPGISFDERYDASPAIWYEDGQLEAEAAWEPDVYDDDPRPGHRAPDGVLDPFGTTLYDRLGNDFGLVVLGDHPELERAFAAEALGRSMGLRVVHLTDPAALEVYGAGAVLVRPDQHVAWRGTRVPEGGAAAVLDRVLGAIDDRVRAGIEE